MKTVHILVEGRVQGVFFRANTKKKAQSLGLTGWVKNLDDGGVEVVAEGERVSDLLEWIKKGGPSLARVKRIEVSKAEDQSFNDFEIRR